MKRSAVASTTRRRLVGILAGLAIGAFASLDLGDAEARAPAREPGGVSVDVRPLLELGLDGFAEIVRADLLRALQAEFAGKLGAGQRVVALVKGLTLASYVGDEYGIFGNNDYLDGIATLVGPDGREISTQKILTVLPASYGGAWYIAGGEQRRVAGLARAFASWARRYLIG